MYPLTAFLFNNAGLLKLVEEDALTPENLRNFHIKMEEIRKVIEESSEEHHQETRPAKIEKPR